MIQVALILLNYVLELGNFEEILISPYALKEGVISTLL